ncbi:MAG: HNH endonuclease, partial [Enterococcus sp.]|nr:HNH endonuclease [Enterococcus sp.]
MAGKSSTVVIKDKKEIETFVQSRSMTMYEYIREADSNFTLYYKTLMHSDLTNRGKRNGPGEGLEKNYLYYLSVDEMRTIEERHPDKPFETAKQSNIGMPLSFYEELGVPRVGKHTQKEGAIHKHILLNDYLDVLLVNDTAEYFTQEYTAKVLKRLDKYNRLFSSKNNINLDTDSNFTEIKITEAIHGLGTAEDQEFHKLRLSMFLNDSICFLIEHGAGRKRLYLLLEKNPKFFSLAGIADKTWEKFLQTQKTQELANIGKGKELDASEDEKTRRLQSAWKEKLAKEMMSYTTEEGSVFCPFTGIGADFRSCSMLFVASHIKRHADWESESESFDINNGLLLSANADALFDKYMISINEEKELIF